MMRIVHAAALVLVAALVVPHALYAACAACQAAKPADCAHCKYAKSCPKRGDAKCQAAAAAAACPKCVSCPKSSAKGCAGGKPLLEKSHFAGLKERVGEAAERVSTESIEEEILRRQAKGDPKRMQELTAEARKDAERRRKEEEKRMKEREKREEDARKRYEKMAREYEKKYDRKYPGTYADYKRHEYYGHPDYARARASEGGWMEIGGSTSSARFSGTSAPGGAFGPSASVREGGYTNTSVGVRTTVIELDR